MGTKHSQRSEPLDTVVSHADAFQIREKEKKVKKTEERHGHDGFLGEKDGILAGEIPHAGIYSSSIMASSTVCPCHCSQPPFLPVSWATGMWGRVLLWNVVVGSVGATAVAVDGSRRIPGDLERDCGHVTATNTPSVPKDCNSLILRNCV